MAAPKTDGLTGIIVGCGFFGHIHLRGWRQVEGARIVAAVDLDGKRAKAAAEQFGVVDYPSLGEAITQERPDFVDIATRPDSHLQVARRAASEGCHILCQKPIAPNWAASVELVNLSAQHGVRLMVNENWRWQPWYREIKELLRKGVIGKTQTIAITRHEADALQEPPFVDQPYFVDMEHFLLIESVIHPIDAVRFLAGEIQAISCHTRRASGVTRGEDNVCVHLNLEDDVWAILYATRCSEPDIPDPLCDDVRIEGTQGFIRLGRDGTITVKPLFAPRYEHVYDVPATGYRGGSCRAALQHFTDCLLSGDPFETEGEDYLHQVMRAVFAGYESAQTGQVVRL